MKLALIMQTGIDRDRIFPILDGRTVIGRDGRCDIRIAMPTISARHCEIAIENSQAVLLSRDANNETLLNGKPIREARLSDADEVQIGPVTFRVAITRNSEDGSTTMSVERDES